jgi:hypothetical protein
MEILDRIAEVVPIRQIWLEAWRVAGECLRVSAIDFEKLAKRPSWEQLMRTRFFDGNGSYFHPLLFVRQGARPSGFIIDKDPVFTRVWLRYHLPPTILRWDRWDMICGAGNFRVRSSCLRVEEHRNYESGGFHLGFCLHCSLGQVPLKLGVLDRCIRMSK